MEITKDDIIKIKELSKDPHIYDKLIKSLVPSIKGHRDIKEAVLLSLIRGNDKKIDGKFFSGGIKILIIGDHNTGKSTILNAVKTFGIKNKFKVRDNIIDSDEISLMPLLKSDKSVICSANFKGGNSDKYYPLINQVGFSQDFLNCFDLIFLIEDNNSKERDDKLAGYILDAHKNNGLDCAIDDVLLTEYIVYSYLASTPKLSDEASDILKEFYISMRDTPFKESGLISISIKHMESLIRLSEACAKIKLKDYVEKEDAEKAVRLHMACLKNCGLDWSYGEIDEELLNEAKLNLISERDIVKNVTEEVKLLEEEFNGNAPLYVLISNMDEKYGVNEKKTMTVIKSLKQKGIVYEPTTGYLRRI